MKILLAVAILLEFVASFAFLLTLNRPRTDPARITSGIALIIVSLALGAIVLLPLV